MNGNPLWRFLRGILRFVVGIIVVLAILWATGALVYDMPGPILASPSRRAVLAHERLGGLVCLPRQEAGEDCGIAGFCMHPRLVVHPATTKRPRLAARRGADRVGRD